MTIRAYSWRDNQREDGAEMLPNPGEIATFPGSRQRAFAPMKRGPVLPFFALEMDLGLLNSGEEIVKSYIIVAIAFFSCACISAEACSLAPIFISVDGHGHAKSYFGSHSDITVSWKEVGEPANHVTVKNLKTGKSCDLPGWPIRRNEMYLSDDGSTFVLVDGGDDDDAKFYRLDTCEQAGHAHLTAEPHQYFVAPTMVGTYGYCLMA